MDKFLVSSFNICHYISLQPAFTLASYLMKVFFIRIEYLKFSNLVYTKATHHLNWIDLEINLV